MTFIENKVSSILVSSTALPPLSHPSVPNLIPHVVNDNTDNDNRTMITELQQQIGTLNHSIQSILTLFPTVNPPSSVIGNDLLPPPPVETTVILPFTRSNNVNPNQGNSHFPVTGSRNVPTPRVTVSYKTPQPNGTTTVSKSVYIPFRTTLLPEVNLTPSEYSPRHDTTQTENNCGSTRNDNGTENMVTDVPNTVLRPLLPMNVPGTLHPSTTIDILPNVASIPPVPSSESQSQSQVEPRLLRRLRRTSERNDTESGDLRKTNTTEEKRNVRKTTRKTTFLSPDENSEDSTIRRHLFTLRKEESSTNYPEPTSTNDTENETDIPFTVEYPHVSTDHTNIILNTTPVSVPLTQPTSVVNHQENDTTGMVVPADTDHDDYHQFYR